MVVVEARVPYFQLSPQDEFGMSLPKLPTHKTRLEASECTLRVLAPRSTVPNAEPLVMASLSVVKGYLMRGRPHLEHAFLSTRFSSVKSATASLSSRKFKNPFRRAAGGYHRP